MLAAGPQGFAERLDRLPNPTPGDNAQIVVEKYSQPGQPDRFEVYVGGTVDFSPRTGSDPFDMTSNISGLAGLPAGSLLAVREALASSGVTASSPVVFTGYSQGGLVASLLASSGDYNTQGVVTIGAPAGQVLLPAGIPAVIIEHTDDLVPALGGTQLNQTAVVAQREAFAGKEVPTGVVVPAHHLEYYRETTVLLDGARSEQVTTAARELDDFSKGATAVTSTRYLATRDG
jgi:pimeloyl-ACP methyl ester carboxylesterase